MSDEVTIRRACDVPIDDLVAGFNHAYSDYIIPIQLNAEYIQAHADLAASYVAINDKSGAIEAVAFIDPKFGPRADRSRIGAFAVAPTARGSGLAQRLFRQIIDEARASGTPNIELECIAQNERAIRFYRKLGFSTINELYGYIREPEPSAVAAAALTATSSALAAYEVSRDEAGEWVDARMRDGTVTWLPHQVAYNWRKSDTARCFLTTRGLGREGGVATTGADALMICHGMADDSPKISVLLIDADSESGRQEGSRLLVSALLAAYPGKTIETPALQRADLGGDTLEAEGFVRKKAFQQELMVLVLNE